MQFGNIIQLVYIDFLSRNIVWDNILDYSPPIWDPLMCDWKLGSLEMKKFVAR